MRIPFTKPSIKASLKSDGGATTIRIDATKEQATLLLYQLVIGIAHKLNMPERQLMNRIITIDKEVVRSEKKKTRGK